MRSVGIVLLALVIGASVLALAAITLVTIHAGAIPIAPGEAIRLLAARIGLAAIGADARALQVILVDIRLPRVALGILTGAGLAVGDEAKLENSEAI